MVTPPTEPPVAAPIDARDDAGWQLYHQAFEALLHRQRNKARALGTRLVRDFPGHPASLALEGSRMQLGIGSTNDIDRPRTYKEQPSRGAQAELALFQGIHGMVLGVELGIAAESEEPAAYLLLAIAGGVTGGLVSVSAVPELTSGKRALLNSGTVWGFANAGLILLAAQPEVDSPAPIVLPLVAGQLAGLAAGASLFRANPTAGQVALANSGGQWSIALTALLMGAAEVDFDGQGVALSLLVAADAGLGAGAYLASINPQVSRAQTLVIDAGGIFGAVAGGGVAVLVQNDFGRPALLGAALGAAAGLGTAAYLTRNWGLDHDDDGGSATTYLAPTTQGRGAVAGMGWRW